MPVFPDDSPIKVAPGRNAPRSSASSTRKRATRSFTEPPGLAPSSLTTMRTAGFGLSWETSTIGVSPIRSSTSLASISVRSGG
jgi:hypothetical protein